METERSRAEAAHERATPGWYPDPAGDPNQRWWNGHQWTKQIRAYPPPPAQLAQVAPPSPTTTAYSWTAATRGPETPALAGLLRGGNYGRTAVVGLLVGGAFLVIVGSFLDWFTLTTQSGIPVPSQTGLDNGGGIWTLALAVFAIVDSVALWAARRDSTASIFVRALWLDAAILTYQVATAFYTVGSGQWQQLVTHLPLTASPGSGLVIVTLGLVTMLLATIRISLLMRRHQWSGAE